MDALPGVLPHVSRVCHTRGGFNATFSQEMVCSGIAKDEFLHRPEVAVCRTAALAGTRRMRSRVTPLRRFVAPQTRPLEGCGNCCLPLLYQEPEDLRAVGHKSSPLLTCVPNRVIPTAETVVISGARGCLAGRPPTCPQGVPYTRQFQRDLQPANGLLRNHKG